MSHGRLARWVLALQEYDLKWEYILGKKNVVADVLSRINLEDQTFEGEQESLVKIYNIFKTRAGLQALLINIRIHQQSDPKLKNIMSRLEADDDTVSKYYHLNKGILLSLIHI